MKLPVEVVSKLIDIGGRDEIVMEGDKIGDTAIHHVYTLKDAPIEAVSRAQEGYWY